jgi:hypothetical protein
VKPPVDVPVSGLPTGGELEGELAAPRAGIFIEALRDIGYSLDSAIADIVDNSIAAQACRIDIRSGWSREGKPWLAILDDGRGMTLQELIEAMRPGTRSPLEDRASMDLGRFGLGLKTASFSQCRRLTVVSRRDGATCARCWDLDTVRKLDEWRLIRLTEEEIPALPAITELGPQGTMILWEKLDRLDLGTSLQHAQVILNERLASITEHLSLVFHRYLAGEPGLAKVAIRLNLRPLAPFDPFNSRNPSTTYLPAETFHVGEETVEMQPFILPHHSKIGEEEYLRFGGAEGYLKSQGFYIYRNKRLIIHGTWFRMARQEELTKLARVRIDIPNTLDHLWTIDVRKSRAHPPEAVRQRMKGLLERIRESARRPYTHRGTVIIQRNAAPVWQRREFNRRIRYEINPEHPLMVELKSDLPEPTRERLDMLLEMIGASFPTALLFSDLAGHPERSDSANSSPEFLERLARHLRSLIPGEPLDDFKGRLRGMEPFASAPAFVDSFRESGNGQERA